MPLLKNLLLYPWRFGCVLLLVLLLLETETGAWLFPPIMLLVIAGLPLLGLTAWLFPISIRRYLLVTGAVLTLVLLGHGSIRAAQENTTRLTAELLIQQIQAYQNQVGKYPDSLQQLTPHYLPAVPQTGYGLFWPLAFYYHAKNSPAGADSSFYELVYTKGSFINAHYTSRTQQWHIDD